MYWICQVCGYDYYAKYEKIEVNDPCLLFLNDVEPRNEDKEEEIRIINESVLNEYIQIPNIWFYQEEISLKVQREFEIGFSIKDERITIPIRDEIGNLVGVKARTTMLNYKQLGIPKYLYLYPVPKTQILYGLDKSYKYIKEKGWVIVFESEKSVHKSFSMGIKNVVSIGGHELSSTQVRKLERLGTKVLLAYDKDITAEQLKSEVDKFIIQDNVYILWDKNGLLGDKESPADKPESIYKDLLINHKYRIK